MKKKYNKKDKAEKLKIISILNYLKKKKNVFIKRQNKTKKNKKRNKTKN